MAKEFSGQAWCSRFPGSSSVSELSPNFQKSVQSFLNALQAAGATVKVRSTFRPPERAYLMHHAFAIAREGLDPKAAPAMAGVDIDWVHKDAGGAPDIAASKKAAEAMVGGYGMAFRAALKSRHTERRAIDMDVGWKNALSLKDARGNTVTIGSQPRTGDNPELHAVGASFGVIKLVKDPPHWSEDGH